MSQTTDDNRIFAAKDKKQKGTPAHKKQECACPSLQSSLRSHTHAFFIDTHNYM